MTINILQLINRPELPSLPEAVMRMNDLIRGSAPITEIAEVVEIDPALVLRTLELANSAWFRRQSKIVSVKDAVTIIGPANLFQIIFSTSVVRAFSGMNSELMNMREFWQQAVYMASSAKALAMQSGAEDSEEIFTAGLLSTIGKLVLYACFPHECTITLETANNENIPQFLAEEKILGINHAQVSAALLDKWNIDESLSVPIQFYLKPRQCPKPFARRADILNAAHSLSSVLRLFSNPADSCDALSHDQLKQLNIKDPEVIVQISAQAQQHYQHAKSLLNIK